MELRNQHIISNRITAYLTEKVKEAFPEDFHLIEKQLQPLTERYSLKELILIVRIEIDQLKRGKSVRGDLNQPGTPQ